MKLPASIEVVEVGARDGLQNEKTIVSTADKITLVRRAVAAGARRIEVASFVNPRRVPQMADAEQVCAGLTDLDEVRIGLTLNRRGAERALATCVDELGTVVSASDGFGIANQGQTGAETLEEAVAIMQMAFAAGRRAQATISVAFGCPYDGEIDPGHVAKLARRLADAGAREIAIADTIGIAGPGDVIRVMREVREAIPNIPLRLHFHDTRKMAVANALAGLIEGAAVLDGSIGGLGGCPFAPGAAGNVATESLIQMLDTLDIKSGMDRSVLADTAQWISSRLGQIN